MQHERIPLILNDGREVTLTRVRDPRAKRIKLTVNERGVRLTVPLRAGLAVAADFVDQHRDWLGAQLSACQRDTAPLMRDKTAFLPLRGKMLPLAWEHGAFPHLRHADGQLHFCLPTAASPATIARAVRDFYESEARADLARWLPRYLPGLPRPPARIRLRVLSSQWGSLAPDGAMSLDLALILGEPSAFEYVLVHELCHLIHANHSRAFWAEVEVRCPDWHSARDYFRYHGRQLKVQLHSLLRPTAAGIGAQVAGNP